MTSNTKISLAVLAVVAVVVGALVMLTRPEGLGGASSTAPTPHPGWGRVGTSTPPDTRDQHPEQMTYQEGTAGR